MFIKVPPGYLSPAFGGWGQKEGRLCGCVRVWGGGGRVCMDVGVAVKGQYAVSDKSYICAC